MSLDRRAKIQALLDSPHDGERQAAREALARMAPPRRGTPEWIEGRREYLSRIEFCIRNLGSPLLTALEVRTLRNLDRHKGNPWERGADLLMPIYRKLSEHEKVNRLQIEVDNNTIRM